MSRIFINFSDPKYNAAGCPYLRLSSEALLFELEGVENLLTHIYSKKQHFQPTLFSASLIEKQERIRSILLLRGLTLAM